MPLPMRLYSGFGVHEYYKYFLEWSLFIQFCKNKALMYATKKTNNKNITFVKKLKQKKACIVKSQILSAPLGGDAELCHRPPALHWWEPADFRVWRHSGLLS